MFHALKWFLRHFGSKMALKSVPFLQKVQNSRETTNHPVRAVDWLEAKTLPNVVFSYYKKIANRLRK